MTDRGFVGISEAARRVGVSRPTVRALVASGRLPSFSTPLDKRYRLIRVEDVDALLAPRPVATKRQEVSVS